MPRYSEKKSINRIIDANINRAKEGLRVCEEITRFILDSRNLSLELKKIRHGLDLIFRDLIPRKALLEERDILSDVGKGIYVNELKRKNCRDIFFANIQRVKESIRVLEEFSKLIRRKTAIELKTMRYQVYEIEKKATKRISSLYYRR